MPINTTYLLPDQGRVVLNEFMGISDFFITIYDDNLWRSESCLSSH